MNPLLLSIITDVAIPETLRIVRALFEKNGHLPTDDEVKVAFQANVDAAIGEGEAFLARTKPTA